MFCQCECQSNLAQFICLSPLCTLKLSPLCKTCMLTPIHANHQIVKIANIFTERQKQVDNALKYYGLNVAKLEIQKKEYTEQFNNLTERISVYGKNLIDKIDTQINLQKQLVVEMIRIEKIVAKHYLDQLNDPVYSILNVIERLLSPSSICPQFEITNLIQISENHFNTFQSNISKKVQLQEINESLNKNLTYSQSYIDLTQDFLDNIKIINNFSNYEYVLLNLDGLLKFKPLGMGYQKDNNELKGPYQCFTEEILPYIDQVNDIDIPLFDTLGQSKDFYDNQFKIIIARYFQQGESLVNLNFRNVDERFFKIPPFLKGYFFSNLRNLSVNVNSTELKNLITFIQCHTSIEDVNILINADQSNLTIQNLQYFFSSEVIPNIKHLRLDITRLNFSSPLIINDIQDFNYILLQFLINQRNKLQTFQIDGLIEFSYSLDQLYQILFFEEDKIYSHLKNLTFLLTEGDQKIENSQDNVQYLQTQIIKQMPLLENIKLFRTTDSLDVQRLINNFNTFLKQKSIIRKILLIIKSRLKHFRKEIILTIINEFIPSISSILNEEIHEHE